MPNQFSPLFLYRTGQSKTTTKFFISDCDLEQEKELGRLFGILEISDQAEDNEEIITNLIENIEKGYYTRENFEMETNFEKTLQNANQKLITLIQEKEIALNPENLNFLIGVIKDTELYISQVGTIGAFLIHQTAENVKMINIIEKNIEGKTNLLKIFSHIINGSIGPHDSLFFTTESILDYISLDKLKKTINLLPPQSVTEHLKNLLIETNDHTAFAAVIIKPLLKTKKNEAKRMVTKSPAISQDSINNLKATEEKTNTLLTTSLWPSIKKFLIIIKDSLSRIFHSNKKIIQQTPAAIIKLRGQKRKIETHKMRKWRQALNNGEKIAKKIGVITSHIIINFSKTAWTGLLIITGNKKLSKEKTQKITENITERVDKISVTSKEKTGKIIYLFNHLSKTSKILLITSAIFILLFIQSVVWLGSKQKRAQEQESYNKITAEIQNAQDNAVASLIYNDENKTREYLLEAQNLLGQLPQSTNEQKEKYATLATEIQSQLEKIRHIINISEPILINDIGKLAQEPIEELISTQGLLILGNNLYIYDKANIYKIDLNNRDLTKELSNVKGNIDFNALRKDDKILFWQNPNILSLYDPGAKTLTSISLSLTTNEPTIRDMEIYNKKLYLLDAKGNQIYKYSQVGDGYGQGQNWLKDTDTNFTDALSLAIDGYIYILKSNGTIDKLLSGYRQDFKIKSIDPALKSSTKIYTDSESNFLYVLDPAEKRLVVLDKEGNLKIQYYSESFDDLKDFVVKESEKQIYLLNGTKIYGVVASHL